MSDERNESKGNEQLTIDAAEREAVTREGAGPGAISRRLALKGAGSMALGVGLAACDIPEADESETTEEELGEAQSALWGTTLRAKVDLPLQNVIGMQGYAALSVEQGSQIRFKLSSPAAYKMSIVRLGWVDHTAQEASKDWTVYADPTTYPAAVQGIRMGSYVHVDGSFPSALAISAMTLECWVRLAPTPVSVTSRRGLITQYAEPSQCGFGLFISHENGDATVQAYFGSGSTFATSARIKSTKVLSPNTWYHVAATFSGGVAKIYVDGVDYTSAGSAPPVTCSPGGAPLRLGAFGGISGTIGLLDGDIAYPVIYSRALPKSEILDLSTGVPTGRYGSVSEGHPPAAPSGNVEAYWPLDEENGVDVRETAANRAGKIVNRGTWMIGGPSFDRESSAILRWPASQSALPPDSERGHALRLSTNDIYDFGWTDSHVYPIDERLPPGLYVGRFVTTGANPQTRDVHFIVKRKSTRPRAAIAVIANTNTWLAYRNWGASFFPNGADTCFYVKHTNGNPTYMVGLNTPLPWVGEPFLPVQCTAVNDGQYYGHLTRAERPLHNWLEQNGYEYDLYTDLDLHRGLIPLADYKIVMVGGHSEYWSTEMADRLAAWINGGGKFICASGNTAFWRVSIDSEVIQCRKYAETSGSGSVNDDGEACGQSGVGEQQPGPWIGECFHSGTVSERKRGGLLRETGSPGWKVTGMDTSGYGMEFVNTTISDGSHPFFHSPEEVGGAGTQLGNYHVGHEFDASVKTIKDFGGSAWLPTEYGGATPSAPYDKIKRIASAQPTLWTSGTEGCETYKNEVFTFDGTWKQGSLIGPSGNQVVSEIIDWDRTSSGGGRVFSTGSIATSMTLLTESESAPPFSGTQSMGRVFRNAIHHMGVQSRYCALASTTANELVAISLNDVGTHTTTSLGSPFGLADGVPLGPNRICVVALDGSGNLRFRDIDFSSGAPSLGGWVTALDGAAYVGQPKVVRWGRDRLSVFVRRTDGHLIEKRRTGASWESGVIDHNSVDSDPGADVFDWQNMALVTLRAGQIAYKYALSGTWQTDWVARGAAPTGSWAKAPTVLAWRGNWVSMFGVSSSGTAYVQRWDGAAWKPSSVTWSAFGGSVSSRIAAVGWGPRQCSIFAARPAPSAGLQTSVSSGASPAFSGWLDFGAGFVDEPSATMFRGGSMIVTVRDANDGNKLKYAVYNGVSWVGWMTMHSGAVKSTYRVIPWTRAV